MKKLMPLIVLLGLVAGCKTPTVTRTVTRTFVSDTVWLAGLKDPKIVPYVQFSTPIFCMAAEGTNRYSPEQIATALNGPEGQKFKTAVAVVTINTILSLYSAAVYEDEKNAAPVLDGICGGLKDGLSLLAPPKTNLPTVRRLPPHVE